jgi:hypothetical protein
MLTEHRFHTGVVTLNYAELRERIDKDASSGMHNG